MQEYPHKQQSASRGRSAADGGAGHAEADTGVFLPRESMQPLPLPRLRDYLASVGLELDRSVALRQFSGGLANRNYLVRIDGRDLVLRRPPAGELPPGAHDMAREHRIMSSLSAALSFVPDSVHLCSDPSVIGAPFQLIEYRPGIVVRGDVLPQPLCGCEATLSRTVVEVMAELHDVEPVAVGLGDLGRPDGFVARNIANWIDRGLRIAGEGPASRLVEETGRWLTGRPCRERPATLLHCDIKLDNIILWPDTLAPRAVVDWDMGTRGDPLFDLATLLSYWTEPDDPEPLHELRQMPTASAGFWSRDEVVRHYVALTGFDADDLLVLRVLAMLKLAVVFLQLHDQWVRGAVSLPRYEGFSRLGQDLLLVARDMSAGRLS